MKTQSISPSFTGIISIPNNADNKSVKLLYNKVSKLVKDNQATADFYHNRIDISSEGNTEKRIKYSLKKFGIKFFNPAAKHVFQVTDNRVTGQSNGFSTWLYNNFRQIVSANKGGITPERKQVFVNVPKLKANAVRNRFNELGLDFSENIKNTKKITDVIAEENLNLK